MRSAQDNLARVEASGEAAANPYRTLVLGASYGSLLSTKLLMAGHSATLVCRESTAAVFNAQGSVVRMPLKGRDGLVDIHSKDLPGVLDAVSQSVLIHRNTISLCWPCRSRNTARPACGNLCWPWRNTTCLLWQSRTCRCCRIFVEYRIFTPILFAAAFMTPIFGMHLIPSR